MADQQTRKKDFPLDLYKVEIKYILIQEEEEVETGQQRKEYNILEEKGRNLMENDYFHKNKASKNKLLQIPIYS